ncbi:MAG: copper amine oxidase N-terminal domain-containing protein [Oscillibacter sp.]|nr:copper amine oxidase N-terminal domain-containing protein [Oscillibacter sp.]
MKMKRRLPALLLTLALALCLAPHAEAAGPVTATDGMSKIVIDNVLFQKELKVDGETVPVCVISPEGATATVQALAGYTYSIEVPWGDDAPEDAEPKFVDEQRVFVYQGGFRPQEDGSYVRDEGMTVQDENFLRPRQSKTIYVTRLANVDIMWRYFVFCIGTEQGIELYYMYDTSAAAGIPNEPSVTINGQEVAWTDARPFIDENHRTQVPLRALANAMGLWVSWNPVRLEANFSDGTKAITFPIGSTTARISGGGTLEMDTAAVVLNDRTYAPARPLGEYFGYSVSWDDATRTVVMNKWS